MANMQVEGEAVAYCKNPECGQRIEPNGEALCLDCRFEPRPVFGDNFPVFLTNDLEDK